MAQSLPSRPAEFDAGAKDRRVLIAKIHVAKKEMALLDDDYRALLVRVTGRLSSAQCTVPELRLVIGEMKARGFRDRPRRNAGVQAADHPAARKARALWISLHQLGAIDNPAEQALEAFARRQLRVDRLQWADQGQCFKLIEALKAIGERHGWSFKSSFGDGRRPTTRVQKVRLVERIAHLLAERGLVPVDWGLKRMAFELGGVERDGPLPFWSEPDLDLVAKALGSKLREAGR